MPKTFTLPAEIHTANASLMEQDAYELIYDSQLINQLSDELTDVSYSPSQDSLDRILAYSKAVRVNASHTMKDGVVIQLN